MYRAILKLYFATGWHAQFEENVNKKNARPEEHRIEALNAQTH